MWSFQGEGRPTGPYLIDAFVLEAMDDEKGPAVNLISIDFAKAFNTMGHQACLRQFARLGASKFSVKMVYAFLQGRKMSVRINDTFSTEQDVPGRIPQGTLLGNFLFIITTNHLEDDRPDQNGSADNDEWFSALEDLSLDIPAAGQEANLRD